jgi:hypothetical protein
MNNGVAIGLDSIRPYSVLHRNKEHCHMEVRLGRGILHGNNAPKPKTDGHIPSKRHRTASKPDRYGILRENKCPATLATDLRVPENQKVSGRSELTKGSCRRTDEGRCSPPVEMLAVEVEIGEE